MRKVYHNVEKIAGNVIDIRADGVKYNELAEVTSHTGTSLAQVIRLQGNLVSLQIFAGAKGVGTDAKVRFLGHPMQVSFSENLLGRVFTGSGEPRDKGPSSPKIWSISEARPSTPPSVSSHATWCVPASP